MHQNPASAPRSSTSERHQPVNLRWPSLTRLRSARSVAKGQSDAFLPLLSHALFFYSRHLAQFLADKGYNAAAKNDVRMVEVRAHCAACAPRPASARPR